MCVQKTTTNGVKNSEREDKTMALLAKPVNVAFELDPKKAKKFFEKADKSACQRAIDRASAHKPITKVRERD